jgi:hypothetical protein
MTTTTTPLFEREMRAQIATAQASVIDAEVVGDPILVDAARDRLDGLIDLARRNGLEINLVVADLSEHVVVIPEPSAEPAA